MNQKRKSRWVSLCVLLVGATVLLAAMTASAAGQKAPAAPGAVMAKPPAAPKSTDGKLRIICFGAHPDDAEFKVGGAAALWAARGHHVKFVSTTNGDIGHWGTAGGPLALRRTAEVEECARILGIQTEVLDIHDGELMVTMENRRTIVRLIRQWRADIVITHRPNDYHPDHRNTAMLVQDAGYMVTVPFFCPDVPYLERNPVFLFVQDGFQKPYPFTPDIVVGIDEVIEKKLDSASALASQTLEGGCNGSERTCPTDPQGYQARVQEVRRNFDRRFAGPANQYRKQLAEWYGPEKAEKIRYAEAFEICEYGRRPSKDEIRTLFPFFPKP